MLDADSNMNYEDYRAWKAWSSTAFGILNGADAAYYSAELGCAGFSKLTELRVLELGFGNGTFAAWAKSRRAEYLGIEVIQELVAQGVKAGFAVRHADDRLDAWVAAESLDLVVAFDVFEHVPIRQLETLLVNLRTRMKSGAVLLARMPSGDSPFARAVQHGDLTHRSCLGSSACTQLAARVGFEVVAVRSPATAWRGVGWLRAIRRLFVGLLRRLVYSFIATFLMGGGQPVLSPNMVLVWRKPIAGQR